MTDQITDDGAGGGGGQQNVVTNDWYADLAPESAHEQLKGFESFDAFLEDYNAKANADWRDAVAGDDLKFKSQLERFSDQGAFGNAYREAQQKIRSGQLRPELPEDASEDQIKEFRTTNNIPLEVGDYFEDMPNGLVVGEDDKEIMMDFMGAMHEINAPKEVAHKMVEWYNTFEERQQEAMGELDAEQSQETDDVLRESWGKDYRANMNLVKGMLNHYFGESAEQLINGRYQDGRGFFNDAKIMTGLGELARKMNDEFPLIQEDPEALKSLNDEIDELEKYQREKRTEYFKDEKAQARLRELYELRLKAQSKDAA